MKKESLYFALAGTALIITFFAVTNRLTSPQVHWWSYAALPVLWWPMGVFFAYQRKHVLNAILGTAWIALYLGLINFTLTPTHPWVLYAFFPALWWPLAVIMKKKAATAGFALASTAVLGLYYGLLNLLFLPSYPYALFIAAALVWWPLGIFAAKRKSAFLLAVPGSLAAIIVLGMANYMLTPGTLWAVYPSFALLWWPLSLLFFGRKRSRNEGSVKEGKVIEKPVTESPAPEDTAKEDSSGKSALKDNRLRANGGSIIPQ